MRRNQTTTTEQPQSKYAASFFGGRGVIANQQVSKQPRCNGREIAMQPRRNSWTITNRTWRIWGLHQEQPCRDCVGKLRTTTGSPRRNYGESIKQRWLISCVTFEQELCNHSSIVEQSLRSHSKSTMRILCNPKATRKKGNFEFLSILKFSRIMNFSKLVNVIRDIILFGLTAKAYNPRYHIE